MKCIIDRFKKGVARQLLNFEGSPDKRNSIHSLRYARKKSNADEKVPSANVRLVSPLHLLFGVDLYHRKL